MSKRSRVGRKPTGMEQAKLSESERELFLNRIDRSGECWLWTANKSSAGYGYCWVKGFGIPTHRVAYELFVGPIPEGLELDHLCENRHCCNPQHLEPVTHKENMRRWSERMTHCRNGHSRDEFGYVRNTGYIRCRQCDRDNDRRLRLRRKISAA